jgi:hypothetical protein
VCGTLYNQLSTQVVQLVVAAAAVSCAAVSLSSCLCQLVLLFSPWIGMLALRLQSALQPVLSGATDLYKVVFIALGVRSPVSLVESTNTNTVIVFNCCCLQASIS